ncbi:glycosyl transferase [Aliarcobacter butzleri]|uniref:glycosyl transferase n=1 Tax=Aliarcobacter butzleri TaxID=28197 RepID=UPI00189DCCFA|nr:glycosyl transferase [Aliarcobacter butzleri]MBF7071121.1 glycosyl transferase [Aliarcobacter butzleri]MCT7645983.1 hypothetical protein [Aliarcobacter butzleri]MDK2083239.1 hypothetical protein [Aliarcobacter butzleri]MDN5128277.1 hypothetical protein [Aliarcobacter butzleri]
MKKIIVSLTTYGNRINSVELTLKTILNQTKKADKIILWLAEDEFNFNNIPKNLLNLHMNNLVEIMFCKDLKSYKKLIPTLKLYSEEIIITFDDDILYKENLIEKLYKEHLEFPNTIICGRGHKIRFNINNSLKKYSKWDRRTQDFLENYDILPTGAGGVLYPPNCFFVDILDENLFLELAPNADDIWFKAMTLMNNRKSKILFQNKKEFTRLETIKDTQNETLYSKNIHFNDKYLKNVFDKYDLYDKFKMPIRKRVFSNIKIFLRRKLSL